MKILKNKKINLVQGFTLIETLIYVAIFMMFVTTLFSFIGTLTNSRLSHQIVLEVNDQGAIAMNMMTSTIRNAISINSPTISNQANSLNIVTLSPGTNPTIFSENGGVLYVTEGGGSQIPLTNDKVVVSGLNFSNLSRADTPDIIKIIFTLTSSAPNPNQGGTYTYTFNGSASLRK